jgi:hypothetical protein
MSTTALHSSSMPSGHRRLHRRDSPRQALRVWQRTGLARAGIATADRNDPLERLTSEQVTRLFMVCVETTGDPYFGLSVARYIHASNIHALGYARWQAARCGNSCLRLERHFAIVSKRRCCAERVQDRRSCISIGAPTSGETEDAFWPSCSASCAAIGQAAGTWPSA